MTARTLVAATAAATISAAGAAAQATMPASSRSVQRWTVDPFHSSVGFAVRHMGLSTVRGTFQKFDATIETEADFTPLRIAATIDPASLETGVERRDGHLRSPDFFDVERHQTMQFVSTHITPAGPNRYTVVGDLTMRGVTRPVTLALEATSGAVTDMEGKRRTGGTLSGTLNRKDWGLTWNQALELGGVLVGEDVTLTIEVSAVAVDEPATAAAVGTK
jgi:polyisoprenoid-binding protein YceI